MYVFCVAMIMQANVEATDFNLLNKYYLRHYRIFLNKSGLNALPTMSFTWSLVYWSTKKLGFELKQFQFKYNF
jgi:hypothetical protein